MISEFQEDMNNDLSQKLCSIAEQAYRRAMSNHGYRDKSGNLRSSIGWGVFFNGRLSNIGGFVPINHGVYGANEGERILRGTEVAPIGYTIVLVVGMKYATLMEAWGKDVSTSAEQLIEFLLDQL